MYKGVLRYHLGLIVPQPPSSCRIRVGPDTRCWAEGRSLIFDDRYPHEAWNEASSHRTVLFVDFVRPLPWPLSLVNRAVIRIISMASFVTAGVNRAREAAQRP
jgi:beta-hydroxylase